MVNFNGVNGAKGLPFGEGSRSDGIKKQETSKSSIFHTNDKNEDNELSAVEMGIDEDLKTLQDKLPKTSTTTEGGQQLSLLKLIIDKLGEGYKYDGKISDARDEMKKRKNDVARILDAIDKNKISNNTIGALESEAAMATIYRNDKVYKEFDKVKPEVEEIIEELKPDICAAAKKAIDTKQPIDYSTIPVERNPEGFILTIGKSKTQQGINKQEGVENDVRSKDGKHILRGVDGGRLTIKYTLEHKSTGVIITGEYKIDLGKDFFGNRYKKEENNLSIEISDDFIEM